MRKVKKAAYKCVYWMIIIMTLLTLVFSVAKFYTPILAKHRVDVQNYLAKALGSDIRIGALKSSWLGAKPVLELHDVTVHTKRDHNKILSIRSLSLGIGIWQSLWQWRIQPELLLLDGARIQVAQKGKDQPYVVRGFERLLSNQQTQKKSDLAPIDSEQLITFDETIPNEVLAWFFNHSELRVTDLLVQVKKDKLTVNTKIARLKLLNNAKGHHFEGIAFLKDGTNAQIRLVGHFKGERLSQLAGKFYAKMQQLPLTLLDRLSPKHDFMINKGKVSFEVWGKWSAGYHISTQANILLQDAIFQNTSSQKVKKVKFLKARLASEYTPKKARVYFKHLAFSPYLKFNKEHNLLWEMKGRKVLLQASHLDLAAFHQWANFFDLINFPKLQHLHLHGALENAQLQLYKGMPNVFFANLIQVSAHNASSVAFNNINGEVYMDPKQGFLKLRGENSSLVFPAPYDRAIKLSQIESEFRWKKMVNYWRVTSDRSYFASDNFKISSSFVFDLYKNFQYSYLALSADVSGSQFEELKPYLPAKGMNLKLRKWLNEALVSVPNISGNIQFKGYLKDFPFDDGQGHIKATLNAQNATVKYHNEWPQAEALDAHVYFKNRKMLADVAHANILGNVASDVSVLIEPIGTPKQKLKLIGQGQFHSKSLVDFLLASPLKNKFGKIESMAFKGNSDLKLNLTLPLNDLEKDKKLLGEVKLEENDALLMKKPEVWLTQSTGAILFDENGIINSKLSAHLFSYPLTLSLSSVQKPSQGLQINADGVMSFSEINQNFSLLATRYMQGVFNYQGQLFFPVDKPITKIKVSSDLRQVSSKLPVPLDKKMGRKQPTRLMAELTKKALLLNITLANRANSTFLLQREKETLKLARGHTSFSKNKALLPLSAGLVIDGELQDLSIRSWRNWLVQHQAQQEGNDFALPLYVDLGVKKLSFYDQTFKKTKIALSPKAPGYQLQVNGEQIKGQAFLPSDIFKLGLDIELEYLYLNKKNHKKSSTQSIVQMENIPPLKVKVKKLIYDKQLLGALSFESYVKDNDFIIHQCKLVSPAYEMKLIGRWQQMKQKHKVEFEGYWQSLALSKALKLFDIDPIIESKKALLSFKVKAKKSLLDLGLSDLKGKLELKLQQGRITKLSKEVEERLGLGKLISILSLQTLPRRLTLDFSDLSNKGFSFDIFTGNFDLAKGSLYTKNTYVDGPVSYVSMKGRLNVLKKDYDLRLKVVPHITASLPVVATIAGGPLAGIAAWVASKIINQSIHKVSSYTYEIKGPWQNPVVHQVNIANVEDKK